ncbi:hypothetical protein [Phenylobacterium soli]|uniref:Uncharacterized protein n=1 Tax=Phenylobacterium soli TaxID=2170551 RepID=A0A328AG10_9CAUL|nr:hypothetical protein [Phenylobacterium soli]RAK53692.1 hypothetical protein DJ017_03700 [Phenylobacterium soli]
MTSPVRPPIFPPSQAAQAPRAEAGRTAAQKAFFDIAMGKATAPAQAPAAAPTASAPAAPKPIQKTPDPTAEAPTRILRPGSLLDIRV